MKTGCCRVVVILSNEKEEERAKKTIESIRGPGKWRGDVVWITIGFRPMEDFLLRWNVEVLVRPMTEVQWLWDLRQQYPFRESDGREKHKLIQFSKWRVFDPYFKQQWSSLLYLDAGMHITSALDDIFSIPHTNRLVAPDDRYPFNDPGKTFRKQWDTVSMPTHFRDLEEYCRYRNPSWMNDGAYFLNCLWLMDTNLITLTLQDELMALLHRFPISKTNEMAIMNLYFHDTWSPLPETIIIKDEKKHVFDWTERGTKKTSDYILLKYPHFPS